MNVGDEHQAVVVQVKSKLDSAREAHERTMSALKLELKAVQMDVMNVQASNQEHDSKRTVLAEPPRNSVSAGSGPTRSMEASSLEEP